MSGRKVIVVCIDFARFITECILSNDVVSTLPEVSAIRYRMDLARSVMPKCTRTIMGFLIPVWSVF